MKTLLSFLAFSLLGICQAQIFTNDWTYTTTLPQKDTNWSSGLSLRYSPIGEFAYSFRYANVQGKLESGVTWIGEDGEVKWEVRATALDQYGRNGQSYNLTGIYKNTLVYTDELAYANAPNTVTVYAIVPTEDGILQQEMKTSEDNFRLSIPPFSYAGGYFSYHYDETNFTLTVKRFSFIPPDPARLATALTGIESDNLIINWETQVGMTYQVQEADDLSGTWQNLGSPIIGTGETMTHSKPATGPKTYLRVLTIP